MNEANMGRWLATGVASVGAIAQRSAWLGCRGIARWGIAWWVIAGSAACAGGGSAPPAPVAAPRPVEASVAVEPAPPAQSVPEPGAGLRLRVHPEDAEIFVNQRRIGLAAELAAAGGVIELAPGLHQILIRRQGYETWRAEVTVRDRLENIDVALEAVTSQ